jgi:hypothetical protein
MWSTNAPHFAPNFARDRPVRQFLVIAGAFWLYVMFSNVIGEYSMHKGMGLADTHALDVRGCVRVMQHVILFPAILAMYWASLRIQWKPLWRALPLQVSMGVVFAAISYPAYVLAAAALSAELDVPKADPQTLWFVSFIDFLFTYCFGLALITGLALYRRTRDAQLRIASLEQEWSAARLAALRMQLSPHTLFNWLHMIRGNIEWDPQAAQSMVVQLADLLRRLLNAGERELSCLSDELQFARAYLQLQQGRFADRLSVDLPQAADVPAVLVPSLILQPLVENAVLHGLAGHQGPVDIRVSARRCEEGLQLRVVNSIAPSGSCGDEGIGLRNVRERLAVQYGSRASMSTTVLDSQWIVQLLLPAQPEAPPLPA